MKGEFAVHNPYEHFIKGRRDFHDKRKDQGRAVRLRQDEPLSYPLYVRERNRNRRCHRPRRHSCRAGYRRSLQHGQKHGSPYLQGCRGYFRKCGSRYCRCDTPKLYDRCGVPNRIVREAGHKRDHNLRGGALPVDHSSRKCKPS